MRIKTNKGDLPIRYSWNALRLICDQLNVTMDDLMHGRIDVMNRPPGDSFHIILYGFIEGARQDKTDCAISTIEDVGDILDDDLNILAEAFTCFKNDVQSLLKGKPGEDDKKK